MTSSAKSAPKAQKVTAVERTAFAIRDRIRNGEYVPGQRLIEADLTESLGISRGPLREAMWRLAGEGIVTIEPNRGVVVRKLTRDETRQLFQLREVLEGLAARLAAENIEAGNNRGRIKKVVKQCEKCVRGNDVSGYIDANDLFHQEVVAMGANEQLSNLLNQLRVPVFRLQFKRMMTASEAIRESMEQHKVVADAILSGEGAQAERAMRKHISTSGRKLLELPDSTFR